MSNNKPINLGTVPIIDTGDAAIIIPQDQRAAFANQFHEEWSLLQRIYAEQLAPRLAKLTSQAEPIYPVDVELLTGVQWSLRDAVTKTNLAVASKNSIQRLHQLVVAMNQARTAQVEQLAKAASAKAKEIEQAAGGVPDSKKIVIAGR